MTAFPDDSGLKWNSRHECTDGHFFTAPVGNYKPNPFGLYDMLGNVWEWCEDVFDVKAYSQSNRRNNPVVTSGGSYRVARGSSWYGDPKLARAARRNGYDPGNRGSYLGFRLLRENAD